MSKSVTGKSFEEKFKKDWIKSFPNGTIDRLYDNTSGYLAISNVSDFICYDYPNMFYIECKAHKGASIPFDNITQYEKMRRKVGIKGVRAGVVLFLYEKEIVLYIPISTITKMKNNGEKSVGIRHIDTYDIIKVPSIMKRVYMDSDYTILKLLGEGM